MGTCEGFPTPTSSAAEGDRPQTSEEAEAGKGRETFATGLPATCVVRAETCGAGPRTTSAVTLVALAWIIAGQVISEGPCPVTHAGLRHICTEVPRGTAAWGVVMDLELTDLEWVGPWVALVVEGCEATIETPDIWILVVPCIACPGLVRAWEVRMPPVRPRLGADTLVHIYLHVCVCACGSMVCIRRLCVRV